jgi:hypothetical protein
MLNRLNSIIEGARAVDDMDFMTAVNRYVGFVEQIIAPHKDKMQVRYSNITAVPVKVMGSYKIVLPLQFRTLDPLGDLRKLIATCNALLNINNITR